MQPTIISHGVNHVAIIMTCAHKQLLLFDIENQRVKYKLFIDKNQIFDYKSLHLNSTSKTQN